jgi:hypothetical protein
VAAAIAAKCAREGCDFAMLLGDNVYENGISSPDDPAIVERFEKVFEPVNLPFYAALGNHDYGHDGLGTDFVKGMNQVLYTSRSRKWRMPDSFYAVSFGLLDIFALDTNMANFERADEQSAKMKGLMQKSRARWKIAFGHHPYISNGLHGNAGRYNGLTHPASFSGINVKNFVDSVVCGHASVYFAGHDHSLQWVKETCNGTELVVSGAGAETTALPGTNPTHFQSVELGFVYGAATEDALTLEMLNDRGQTMFTRTIHSAPRGTP